MSSENNIHEMMQALGQAARRASYILALTSNEKKNQTLKTMAATIRTAAAAIQEANDRDVEQAQGRQCPASFLDRLKLNAQRIESMAKSLENIAEQNDPVGKVLACIDRPNGLVIQRVSVPLGVIGVIYESRPNVTADAAGLCLKAGNAVILRGGSDSFHSSMAIVKAIHQALQETGLPLSAVQMPPSIERDAVKALLKMDRYIDVLIPRGGPQLIEQISAESRIPLFKHLAGLCHTYIHRDANPEMAIKVVLNAKMRRTGICGATEVLLIDQAIVHSHLPIILDALLAVGCEIRGDAQVIQLNAQVKPADEKDYDTEFLAPIIAVKVVSDLSEAIGHIRQHGTQHTEAIITENLAAADQFFREVDSAIIMHNASTQFADGGEFGMGAEMGIATGKLHARGPVGAEQLTTFKYLVEGQGQVRP